VIITSLSSVSIAIKTFLRDEKLYNTISEIRRTMPDARMIIADDGEMTEEKDGLYAELVREGHQVIVLPYDSGFGLKSNMIVEALQTPYVLIASDDFDFSSSLVREGIERLVETLKSNPDIDIASGRVNHTPYEFELIDQGSRVVEVPVVIDIKRAQQPFIPCDLTVNYSLIRKEVFNRVRWDDEVKIGGGEHGSFYLDCKRAGIQTVWVPGVNINEQKTPDSQRYRQFRNRARDSARPCFDKRGVREYVLGNGQVDYDATPRSR
jgi:hypothetical protein